MAESFGARLRHKRERQRIELSFIAEQTKISVSLLEALERDDVSQWPTGIFRRSFVRDYARIIGLEPDPVVREFLDLYPDHVNQPVPEPDLPVDFWSRRPPIRLRYLVASAVSSIRARLEGLQPPETVREAAINREVQAYSAAKVAPVPEAPFIPAPPVPEAPSSPAPTVPAPSAVVETHQEKLEFSPVTELCAELDRAAGTREVGQLLDHATRILDAKGLVVWTWDPEASGLKPTRVHGYPLETAARLPIVRRDADNATAAAFRSAEFRVVAGGDQASGAVVAPLLTPAGCLGVLAIELQDGGEQNESVHFLATRLAAQVATYFADSAPIAEVAAAVNT